jgi:hypothetical protein
MRKKKKQGDRNKKKHKRGDGKLKALMDGKRYQNKYQKKDPADKALARVRHIWFGTGAIPLLRYFFRAPKSQKFGERIFSSSKAP